MLIFCLSFRIYADAVINHMTGGQVNQTGTGGSPSDPVNQKYPTVPYGPSDFNPVCSINGDDYHKNADRVRNCQLVGLNDLNQVK